MNGGGERAENETDNNLSKVSYKTNRYGQSIYLKEKGSPSQYRQEAVYEIK